jgi:hypothetical protein
MKHLKGKLITIIFLFTCVRPVQTQSILYERHDIETNFNGIKETKMIDLDIDGDLDIVGGSEITPTSASEGLAWWRNNGNNTWERFIIDPSFIHVMSVDAAFIDNDIYPDIVATSWQLNQVAWWKNSGDPTQGWTKYIIKSNFTNAHDAKCADIDNDGDIDIVTASYELGRIDICVNDGISLSNWPTTTLTNNFGGALCVLIKDMDKDGDLDILGTASDANLITWWQNQGGNPPSWLSYQIASDFIGSSDLHVIDMNLDGIYDVIGDAWKSNQVAYWICNNLQGNSWSEYIVTSNLLVAAGVSGGDLDKDGDVDIVAVGKVPGELAIYQNSNFNWTKIVLTNDFEGGEGIQVLDLDGDGDLDIVSAASSGKLIWWDNKTPTAVIDDNYIQVPQYFNLEQNYPNPFNTNTTIRYQIPELSFVTLKVYDMLGREVAILVEDNKNAGSHQADFNADGLTSGIYFYRLQYGNAYEETNKMIYLK